MIAVIQAPSINFATRTTRVVMPGSDGPQSVYENVAGHARTLSPLPMHDHAGLGQGEGGECANGIERDKTIGDTAEDDQQKRREANQRVHAVGVKETSARAR